MISDAWFKSNCYGRLRILKSSIRSFRFGVLRRSGGLTCRHSEISVDVSLKFKANSLFRDKTRWIRCRILKLSIQNTRVGFMTIGFRRSELIWAVGWTKLCLRGRIRNSDTQIAIHSARVGDLRVSGGVRWDLSWSEPQFQTQLAFAMQNTQFIVGDFRCLVQKQLLW